MMVQYASQYLITWFTYVNLTFFQNWFSWVLPAKWSTLAWIFSIFKNDSNQAKKLNTNLYHNYQLFLQILRSLILAVIIQKYRNTWPGVADRHLIQNLSNFYHIFLLKPTNSKWLTSPSCRCNFYLVKKKKHIF